MNVTEEMYLTLFNSITDVQEKVRLARRLLDESITEMESAQRCTEEISIANT